MINSKQIASKLIVTVHVNGLKIPSEDKRLSDQIKAKTM